MFFFWSSLNHIPIKYWDSMKKMSHLRPIYFNGIGPVKFQTDESTCNLNALTYVHRELLHLLGRKPLCVCGCSGSPPSLVTWFISKGMWVVFDPIFMFSLELLLIRYSREIIWCCNSKSTMKHQQKLDWKLDLLWVNCDCQKNCMFVDFKTNTYKSSQLCSLSSVKWFIKFENMVQCLLNITCVSIDLNCFLKIALGWTFMFWLVSGLVVMWYLKEIGPRFQILLTTPHSIMNTLRRTYVFI
jgi:hypothetical protein